VTVRIHPWIAAAVGLWMAQPLPAQEPSRLGVEPGQALPARIQPSPNQQIADKIVEHLQQCGQLRHYTVHVAFQGGTAELTGAVADQMQREQTLRIVQGVPGVESVRDHLQLVSAFTQVQANEPPALREPPPVPPKVVEPDKAPAAGIVEPTPLYQAAPSPYDLNPPRMPPYAWPTYAPYNNYGRVAYPTLYPYQSWPFIGPIYPFPKIPLGWRKVKLEWQDGKWWYGSNSNGHDWWRLRYW
jgi:hypothetical protein